MQVRRNASAEILGGNGVAAAAFSDSIASPMSFESYPVVAGIERPFEKRLCTRIQGSAKV